MQFQKLIRSIVFLAALGVFVYSGGQLLRYQRESQAAQAPVEDMIHRAVVTEPAESAEEFPISVDFEALRQEDPDVVGWIYSPDTPIHYPILQTGDNDFYLTHSADGEENPAGSIFADCRCAGDFSDPLTVIYGHHRKNDDMFGTLVNYADQSYYEAHPRLYILTPEGNYILELLAGCSTDADDVLYAQPMTEFEALQWVTGAVGQSDFESPLTVWGHDRFVALSTCAYEQENGRYVVVRILKEA